MPEKIKVLFASSEVAPLAQTGGLAEVAGSLPPALSELGFQCAVITPAYAQTLKKGGWEDLGVSPAAGKGAYETPFRLLKTPLSGDVPAYLVRHDPYFNREGLYELNKTDYPDNPSRFAFFSKAVLASLPHLEGGIPDVVVANDWQTGLVMAYLKEAGPQAPKGLFVIHNLGFLGVAPAAFKAEVELPESYFAVSGLEYYGSLSFLKAGIVYSDALATVSPTYAKEIQTPEFGNGLDGLIREHAYKLHGILNGVDVVTWNPETDPHLPAAYSPEDMSGKRICKEKFLDYAGLPGGGDPPLFAMVSRLTTQKGVSLLIEAAEDVFNLGAKLAILGTGDPWFQDQLQALAGKHPKDMWLKLDYNVPLAHQIIAASDFMLVPSMYEPCGLTQLFAFRYGSIPVVRATGGLNDTVRDFAGKNPEGRWDSGFKFAAFNHNALFRAVRRAAELYRRREDFLRMRRNNMLEDFSWKTSAFSYSSLVQSLAAEKAAERT
ncbi:MAG: glycogen synthase GlgA [Deltaproteobacteria bacterium]|jgi:starch synthase|nr:glycogen synthase GlgA [Deltaproteobacteria bacterium]